MMDLAFTKYCQNFQIKEDETGKACGTHRNMRNVKKILDGKPEGKRPFGRLRHRWEDNIKIDLREIRCRGVD
jgi:hypothetical protein